MFDVCQEPPFRIIHKGLVLILVPFFLNCIWLSILWVNLDRSGQLVRLEHQQSEFVEHLMRIMSDSFETRQSLTGYLVSRNRRFLERSDKYLELTESDIAKLIAMPNKTPEQKVCAHELAELLGTQLKQIRKLVKTDDQQLKIDTLFDIQSTSENTTSLLAENIEFEKQMMKQRRALDTSHAELSLNRELVQNTVLLGVLSDLFLTVSLIIYLSKDISKRLSVLVENAGRLSRRETLSPPVGGNDELTFLDSALHHAADEIRKAFELRKTLVQMVAHDLRSPLFACQIALETALSLDKERLSAKGHKQLQSIRINIERLVRIINDLLLIEQYESDTINLNTALENLKELSEGSILSMLALAEKKQIKLENRVPNIYLELDRERIMQVLVNYLSNAIKFSPIGATVVVTASIVGECAEVAVTDTGPGLRAQDARMIFEKFFQAADGKQLGGNGLGLTIAKLIIEAHAGFIGVSSEPGNGSTFWFRLPVKCSRD